MILLSVNSVASPMPAVVRTPRPLTAAAEIAAESALQLYDMDGAGVSLEELEEYNMVVSKTFTSEVEGYEFYYAYARVKGFGVTKDELNRKADTNVVFGRIFCCSKQGYRSRRQFETTNRKRNPRAFSHCGCDAKLEMELNTESDE